MASSTSSSEMRRSAIPLVEDLRTQSPLAQRFVARAFMLLVLFLGVDRVLGWVVRTGLDRYYGLNAPAAVLCVGHSHTVLGIDKVMLEQKLGVPVAKFALEGANTSDRLIMTRYFFARHPNGVRAVLYDVDAHTFTGSGLSSSSYQLLFPFIDDPDVRAYIKRNCPSSAQYLLCRLLCAPRYSEQFLALAVRGYLKNWSNFKPGTIDPRRLGQFLGPGRLRHIAFDPDNLKEFANTVEFVRDRGATMFLVYIPTLDQLNQAEPEKFARAMGILAQCAATNSQVALLDYNKELQGRHELFYDPIHMNRQGQGEVTERLVVDLKLFFGNHELTATSTNVTAAKTRLSNGNMMSVR